MLDPQCTLLSFFNASLTHRAHDFNLFLRPFKAPYNEHISYKA